MEVEAGWCLYDQNLLVIRLICGFDGGWIQMVEAL